MNYEFRSAGGRHWQPIDRPALLRALRQHFSHPREVLPLLHHGARVLTPGTTYRLARPPMGARRAP